MVSMLTYYWCAITTILSLSSMSTGVMAADGDDTSYWRFSHSLWHTDTYLNNGMERNASLMIFIPCGVAILFAAYLYLRISAIKIEKGTSTFEQACFDELLTCYLTVTAGAKAFLFSLYSICAVFIFIFSIVVVVLTSRIGEKNTPLEWEWKVGALTMASFIVGAATSILSGYIGMMIAVYSNARTTVSAAGEGSKGWIASFNCAFRAGAVAGFALCGISIAILYGMCLIYRDVFSTYSKVGKCYGNKSTLVTMNGSFRCIEYERLFECIAGYGLGGSAIAMFGRVGGGIFTKAADVGADLSSKVIGLKGGKKLDEDSPYNPAVIADNVGDNVGDVAGMGSDLFGSLGEASCAAMLIGASCVQIRDEGWAALVYPLFISSIGAMVCLIMHFVATDIMPVRKESDIETVLKIQLLGTSLIMTGVSYPFTVGFLPWEMSFKSADRIVNAHNVYGCVLFGLWAGCLIGFITEYFTSHSYKPVREVAKSCETGAATGIIYGVALGYLSCVIPVGLIAATIYFCLKTAGMYGVAIGSLGMLSTLATCLSIDVYGPISDNAGGMAEMSEFPSSVRDKTDALDAAGNTTAAIGKGFAIGSAALVSLALIGAFITRCATKQALDPKFGALGELAKMDGPKGVNLMSPVVFACLVFGANLPYWFCALTMKSVGVAANAMVKEVARQWDVIPGLSDTAAMSFEERAERRVKGEQLVKPDYAQCIKIATNASLWEMIPPAALVLLTPILMGSIVGVEAVVGMLAGSLVSAVQLAISMSNTGGAWDNAKKYVEKGELNGWIKFHDPSNPKTDEEFFKMAAAPTGHGDGCLLVERFPPPGHKGIDAGQSLPPPPQVTVQQDLVFPAATPVMFVGQAFGSRGDIQVVTEMVAGSNLGEERGEERGAETFKDVLSALAKEDPARYRRIMDGDEGVKTTDGRYVRYAGKKSAVHSAAVVGDTVGDPFKDTSGPALNIVMKLMAIIAVVFADFFMSINSGNGASYAGTLFMPNGGDTAKVN